MAVSKIPLLTGAKNPCQTQKSGGTFDRNFRPDRNYGTTNPDFLSGISGSTLRIWCVPHEMVALFSTSDESAVQPFDSTGRFLPLAFCRARACSIGFSLVRRRPYIRVAPDRVALDLLHPRSRFSSVMHAPGCTLATLISLFRTAAWALDRMRPRLRTARALARTDERLLPSSFVNAFLISYLLSELFTSRACLRQRPYFVLVRGRSVAHVVARDHSHRRVVAQPGRPRPYSSGRSVP